MKINQLKFIAIVSFIILLSACNLPGLLTLYDFSSIYDIERKQPNFDVSFYNKNDEISECIFEFKPNSLSYVTLEDSINLTSKLLIHFDIFYSYQNDSIIDSLSIVRIDTLIPSSNNLLQFIIPLGLKKGKNYLVIISVKDLLAKTYTSKHFVVNKTNTNSRNNFVLKNNNNQILYRSEINNKDTLSLIYSLSDVKNLIVRCYYRSFNLPLPPFSIFEPLSFAYKADSIFTIKIENGISEQFVLKKQGFYHIQADTLNSDGFTIFNFYKGYPDLKTTEQLILPSRYIMTIKEFEAIQTALDKKDALERFWLFIGNSPERTKVLIKKYFNRVVYANKMFTSHVEGWKTDRGMLYIVLGKPSVVNRTDIDETWYYGSKGNFSATRFDFVKVLNPFTANDYILVRAPMYKDIWYNAVDNWRR